MTQYELKELIRRSDEKPVLICLSDGASYKIAHPDFAFVTSGSLILASGPGHELHAEFIVCPISHIARVEVQKQQSRSK